MKKYAFIIGILLLGSLPAVTNAALTTDFSTYITPATVNFAGATPGSGNLVLYQTGTTLPICNNGSYGVTSGNLVTYCTSFNGSIAGNYKLVIPMITGCGSLSYSACAAANTNIPGSSEADFTVTTPIISYPNGSAVFGIPATTNEFAIVDNPTTDLFYGFIIWFISFFGMIWLLRKH